MSGWFESSARLQAKGSKGQTQSKRLDDTSHTNKTTETSQYNVLPQVDAYTHRVATRVRTPARRPSRLRSRPARAMSRPGRRTTMRGEVAIWLMVVVTSMRRSAIRDDRTPRSNWRLPEASMDRASKSALALLKAFVMAITSGAASPKVSGFCLAIASGREEGQNIASTNEHVNYNLLILAILGEMVALSEVMIASTSVSVDRATGEAMARLRKERTKRIATEAILENCILEVWIKRGARDGL
jgi:hypothetical protein